MSSVNKVILVGHLGADPEIRQTSNGDTVSLVRIATTEVWKDRVSGEKKEQVDWHRVVFYGRLAEIVRDYLKKGRLIFIEGRLQTRKWQDQQTGQDRYMTEIVAAEMKMLGTAASSTRDGSDNTKKSSVEAMDDGYAGLGDDIPF